MEEIKKKEVKRISRDVLREMRDGESVVTVCVNGYALDSQRNIAYRLQKMENCRFSCKSKGCELTVTRHNLTPNT